LKKYPGTLFLSVLFATGSVGKETNIIPNDDWKNVAEPYLIGTFALGGVVNTMPVTYASLPLYTKIKNQPSSRHKTMRLNTRLMSRYRYSVCLGVILCYIFNLIWCHNVLEIVSFIFLLSWNFETIELW